jgi:glycosyltransferase involved in cell wall biosynthesis
LHAPPPLFSIIISTHNRPGPLAACLEACARLDFPRAEFEVVVVDDGGSAPLEALAASFRNRLNLVLISQAQAGPGPARNTGAAHARGRYLAFTDDDCAPAPGWLRALQAALAGGPKRLVGGRVVNALPDNPYAAANQAILDLVYLHTHFDNQPGRFFTTNNMALPAEQFSAVGGFYEYIAEDRDYCDRWLALGYELLYVPEAIVCHTQELDFGRFCRLHFEYGIGAFHYHQARSRRRSSDAIPFFPLSLFLMFRNPFEQRRQAFFPIGALLLLARVVYSAGFFVAVARAAAGYARGITLHERRSPSTPAPR